ncbi:alpha-galactosidase [Massilia luteola]|uniref:alpha-galactosidase n=1 Tax=Massilia luteola TaxID=3081751 RepID=UPI002ACC3218|nr:alpha-galactosidase [Massilia sp. Gc5]
MDQTTTTTPPTGPARPRRRTVLQAMFAGLGAINASAALADAGQPAPAGSAAAGASDTATIAYDPQQRTFHLRTPSTSYILQVLAGGMLAHVYWGRRLHSASWPGMRNGHEDAVAPAHADLGDRDFSPNTQPQEFPGYGTGDFRHPAYQVRLANGTTVTDLRYASHRIVAGKPRLEGLPATYVEGNGEATTLEITLRDAPSGLVAVLSYTAFAGHDAIARSVRFTNDGRTPLRLARAYSAAVDFPHANFELLHLSGDWAREREIVRRRLEPGMQGIESRRGASGLEHNPFIALLAPGTGEDHGEVYGFSLVYSGSFAARVEVGQYRTARVSMGINDFDFEWLLEPGQSFQAPELVMVYSAAGLDAMSRTYHGLYRSRLARGTYRDKTRPVLINNWEATYFNFDATKLEAIARAGSDLGIELFVLDDGWFGKRDDDHSSLGDWVVDKRKLPAGLADLAGRVNKLGMQFGLWFEPEMISVNSDLYRAHPDWCLHVPGHDRTEQRHQLVLDLSRKDVCAHVLEAVSAVLRSAPIAYVKWDMNRNMSEIGSSLLPPARQRETAHRYMLGLYGILDTLTSRFPNVLFESCASGGGRFDPGMLYYMPQTWTSDNSDAISRLRIQYATSLVYPLSAMGSHVSAVPNHQVGRVTPLRTRGNVAMSGNFGYELDLTKMGPEDKAEIKRQVAQYKALRGLIQFGDFHRLRSPFEGNDTAWMVVAKDQSEAFVVYVHVLAEANAPLDWLRLRGLDPAAQYVCAADGKTYGGDQLMYAGLILPAMNADFLSTSWHLRR